MPLPLKTRFVILHHLMPDEDARSSHYDLMIERDGVLLTWAMDELPLAETKICATRLADHRMAYLDLEGPISGNRGEVKRVEFGAALIHSSDESLTAIELRGQSLSVGIVISPILSADENADRQRLIVRSFDSLDDFRDCLKASP